MSLIQIKRGQSANVGALTLTSGEPAFTLDTGKLYIGNGTGKVLINPDLGNVASLNTGTSSGNIPVLGADGKLADSVIPKIAITDTFVVASQTEMLALTAEVGDIAIRSDITKSFILKTAGASTLANWQELICPTDAVSSVNGKTGAVTLNATEISLSGYVKPATASAITATDKTQDAIGKLEKALDGKAASVHTHVMADVTDLAAAMALKAPLASPALTGTPTAPTATAGTNTTQVATTAFVANAVSSGVGSATGSNIPLTGYTLPGTTSAITATDTINQAIGKLERYNTNNTANLALKANLAGPQTFTGAQTFSGAVALSGGATSTTPATSDSSTSVATTAFVKAQNYVTATTAPVTSVAGKTGAVTLASGDVAAMTGYAIGTSAAAIAVADTLNVAIGKLEYGKAPIASPTFTGAPKSVTPAAADNSTNIATTAFVNTAITTAIATIDGGTF